MNILAIEQQCSAIKCHSSSICSCMVKPNSARQSLEQLEAWLFSSKLKSKSFWSSFGKGMAFSRSSSFRIRNSSASSGLGGSAWLDSDSQLLALISEDTSCLSSISAVILRVRMVNSGKCWMRQQAEILRLGLLRLGLERQLCMIQKGPRGGSGQACMRQSKQFQSPITQTIKLDKVSHEYMGNLFICSAVLIQQSFMNSYFSATEIHLDDRCLLDTADPDSAPVLTTLGTENMIYRLNTADNTEERYNLNEGQFDAMAIAPDATHCLIGGKSNTLFRFDFADSSTTQLLETLGNITAIKYAPSSQYVAVGSEEGKTIIYEPNTNRKEKCRPGHTGAVCSIAISKSGNLLASIGKDQTLLVYRISLEQQPVEVARYQITRMENCLDLTCSFHFSQQSLYSSGSTHLQKLQCVQNKWEHSTSQLIFHNREIIMVQVVKPNTIVTSSMEEVCIWSIKQEEKLFVIEEFNLLRVVPLKGRFFGTRNDGKVYEYQRELREEEAMDIEQQSAENEDEIRFDQEEPEREDAEQQREIDYHQHKKTKADKMIKVYPQTSLTNATQPFEGSRFLFVNLYGCVIERQQGDEESTIQVELNTGGKQQKLLLSKSKSYSIFAINEMGVVFANDKQLGFKPSSRNNTEEWLLEMTGVEAVAMGAGWIAVATDSSIRIFDIASHQIRSISFDRSIVALRAFENILVVVYHQSVPLWEAQQLSMQHFLINSFRSQIAPIANTHVPIKRTSLLHWFDFSREGMLFSQDSTGEMRAFSLETSEWTSVYPDAADTTGKFWIIGIENYKLTYWKTTKTDPEPTVAPRFEPRGSEFSIATVGTYPEGTQETYEKLLWRRYVLDHQKARTRLWNSLKVKRAESNLFFRLSASILSEKEIARRHNELDEKYFALIEKYLKAKEIFRAMFMAQNCIRSEEAARKLIQLFDFENQRSLAIQFEQHCDEMQKVADYEKMQIFSFMKLREEAEKSIKPRSQDPMKRGATRKAVDPLPSLSQSFLMSQESVDRSQLNSSKLSNTENLQTQNPFLRKKSNHESLQAKKKEISDQIQRFGVKQKVDKRAISKTSK